MQLTRRLLVPLAMAGAVVLLVGAGIQPAFTAGIQAPSVTADNVDAGTLWANKANLGLADAGVVCVGGGGFSCLTGDGTTTTIGNGAGGALKTVTSNISSYEAYTSTGTITFTGRAAATTTAWKLDTANAYTTSSHVLFDVSSGANRFKVTGDGVATPSLGINLPRVTLSTCASGTVYTLENDATGGTGGLAGKPCFCTLEADGTTYRWHNIANYDDATGTTTTCPNTLAGGAQTEWTFSGYDPLAGTSIACFAKTGPTIKASTLNNAYWVQGIAGAGGTTQTVKICSSNTCGTVFGTCTPTCTSAVGTETSCTVNTAAIPSGTTLFWCTTATTCTTDSSGTATAHIQE